MTYQEALDYIYSYIDYERMARPRDPAGYDLRRTEELLARIGSPHLKARSVHIAGTNGKGSTAAMLASVLTASGYTTGLYTSPHLSRLNERIRVDGRLISDDELIALVEKLKGDAEAVSRKATYGKLTTFEFLTALAFACFEREGVDFQVLEVGLGGRLDATNVINPEVSVITSISFDHTEVLGDTLAEVATEKAGIIKPGGTVVTSPQTEEVAKVLGSICRTRQAGLIRVGRDVSWRRLSFSLDRQVFQVEGRLGSYRLSIPLSGRYQLDNAAAAVAALEVLVEKGFNISAASLAKGLEEVNWQGRLQVLSHHPLVVVDGAHNPDGARRLRQSLQEYFDFDHAILVIGISCDKDVAGIASGLAPLFDRVIVTRSRHPRAMPPAQVETGFVRCGKEARVVDNVASALSLALSLAGERGLVCVTGSLFVVGEATEEAGKVIPLIG